MHRRQASIQQGSLVMRFFPHCNWKLQESFLITRQKYIDSETKMICPPNLHANKLAELENLILSSYKGLRCKGLARVDVIQDMSGEFFFGVEYYPWNDKS